jgi:hypothetical protein
VTYWLANSLDYQLSADTMWAVAKSCMPLGRAKLPAGTKSSDVPIEQDAYTP